MLAVQKRLWMSAYNRPECGDTEPIGDEVRYAMSVEVFLRQDSEVFNKRGSCVDVSGSGVRTKQESDSGSSRHTKPCSYVG